MSNFIYVLIAFIVMSVVGFASMGIDKSKAKNKKWRIPEATLFMFAILFGGVGSTLGMYIFRHKTQHWYFKVFFPVFAIIDIAILVVSALYL